VSGRETHRIGHVARNTPALEENGRWPVNFKRSRLSSVSLASLLLVLTAVTRSKLARGLPDKIENLGRERRQCGGQTAGERVTGCKGLQAPRVTLRNFSPLHQGFRGAATISIFNS